MTSLRKSAPLPSDQLEPVFRLLRRAARFWWVGVLAAVVVGGGALAAILLYPRQYRSEASLQYREGMQWSAEDGGGGRRMSTRLREMALSRAQLATIIEELGLFPELVRKGRIAEAVEEMRTSTGFRFDQSDVFSISFHGESPEQAQRVTARLVEMLIAENKQLRSQQAEIARQFLDEEKQRKAQDLAAREAEQLRFLSKHPEFAQEQTTGMGVTLRARQHRAQAAAPAAPAAPPDFAAPAYRPPPASSAQDGALVAAKNAAEARLTTALRELADRRSRLTEQHPDTRVARANAAEAEQAYRRAADALAAAQTHAAPQAHASHPPPRPAASVVPAPLPAAASERTVAVETEWARLSREVNEARERLQQLDNQQFRAAMTASMLTSGQTGQILVIDPPFLPARPVGVRTKVLVLLALAAALAIGLLVAGVLGLLDDLIYDPADVERLQIAPVLAEVTRRSLRPMPGPGRSSGGAAMPGNDLDHPTRLPRARQLATIAARRDLALPAGRDHGAGAMVVAATSPRAAAAEAAEAAARPPASGVLVHMADAVHDGAKHKTRYFSFVADFSDAGGGDPEVRQGAYAVRIHRVAPAGAVDEGVIMATAPDSPAASSFRVLRHRLAERGDVKALLVTSPRTGEGKTLAAANLALALGEGGRARVLLVEANFRTPAVARLLGFAPPVGLAEQFEIHREQPSEPWDVVETFAPWLHVLAVAPARDEGAALDGRALAVCIEELRHAGYDHIVVDSPAVLESADVNLIEESVDGIVVAMWARRSHARAFRDAAEQVGGGKLMGVVLLGT